MKKKSTIVRKKYAIGGTVQPMVSPDEIVFNNNLIAEHANNEVENNDWVKGLNAVGGMLNQFGSQMISSGVSGMLANSNPTSSTGQFMKQNSGSIGNMAGNIASFAGNRKQYGVYAMGGRTDENTPIEVEGEEILESPTGEIAKIKGPSHEEGGVDVNVPKGTKIYSDRIKKFGDSMAERKVARENKKLRLEKLLEKNRTDKAIKNTYNRGISALEEEEKADLQTQEMFNNIMGMMEQFAYGTGEEGYEGEEIDPLTGKPIVKKATRKEISDVGINSHNSSATSRYTTITGYQSGVTNTKYGSGAYIFSPEISGGREFVSESALNDVHNSPAYKLYKEKLAAQIRREQAEGKPVSSYMHLYARGTGPDGVGDEDGDGIPDVVDIDFMNFSKKDMSFSTNIDGYELYNPKVDDEYQFKQTQQIVNNEKDSNKNTNNTSNRLSNILGNVNIGNAVGLFGDMYSAFQPMENTLENRAGDTPNINAFKDYGKKGLETLDKTKQYVNQVRDELLSDLQLNRTASVKRNRNSARGINTTRALDLATDSQINEQEENAYSTFAQQMMSILGQQAGMENQQDQIVMGGEQARDLADRQDRDNFYTQKAKDIATKGQGIQTISKDINAIRQNQMMNDIINQLSKYGLGFDKNGQLIQLTKTT